MGAIDQSTLDGFFKEIYGEYVVLKEETSLLQKHYPFVTTENLGGYFVESVEVQPSHGLTIAGSSANSTLLNDPIPLVTQKAQVRGTVIYFSDWMTYSVATRAATTRQAFMDATKLIVSSVKKNAERTVELLTLYGQSGITICLSSANVSATQTTITGVLANWAPGMWEGAEGLKLQFYNGSTLVSSGTDSIFQINTVNSNRLVRTITVTGTATGITALDAAILANPSVIKLCMINGGVLANEQLGLHEISGSTSGVIFNISATTYNQWKANTYNVGGQLTFEKLQIAVAQAASRGLYEDVNVYVNWMTWANLANQANATRMTDSSYGTAQVDLGSKSIKYWSAAGIMNIYQHQYCWEGFGYILPVKRIKRIGSTDVTFKFPVGDDQYLIHRPDRDAYEIRAMTDQAPFCDQLKKLTRLTGIVN